MSKINQEINELIQSDIDGTISDEGRNRLAVELEQNDRARKFYEDCQRMAEALDALTPLEPPAGIAAAVLASAAETGEAAGEESRVPLRTLFAILFEFPVLRYALAFLIGAVFASGVSQMRVTDQKGMDVAGLAGTMSSVHQFTSRQSYGLEQLQGQLELLHAEEIVQLRFELESTQPVEVVVSFGEESYDFSGFLQDISSVSSLSAGEGRVALTATGEQRFTVQLSAPGIDEAPIEVSFNSGGATIEALTVAPETEESP